MKKINVLQSWRAIFIMMICIEHMALTNKLSFFAVGGEGVTFFIVLSGFFMSYVYMDRIKEYTVKAQKEFTMKKIKKFYPLHIIALLAALLLQVLVVLKNEGMVISSLADLFAKTVLNALFLQVYIPKNGIFMNNVNGVVWFLSTIVFCYANSIFALKFLKKVDSKKKWCILFMVCLMVHTAIVELFRRTEYETFVLYVSPFFRFIEYFIGMMLGKWFLTAKKEIDRKKGTALEILAVVVFLINHIIVQNGFWSERGINYNYGTLGTMMILVVVFALESGYISTALNNRILIYFGDISFEIYIMHQVIIKYVTTVFGWNNIGAIISAIAIILFAVLTDRYFDDIRKRIFGARKL